MNRPTRPVSWIKAARKVFEDFRAGARNDALDALSAIAEGEMPATAKPPNGLGSGVLKLAQRHHGDAYQVVYALQLGPDIWLVHAFQKKAKSGIATPRRKSIWCASGSSV